MGRIRTMLRFLLTQRSKRCRDAENISAPLHLMPLCVKKIQKIIAYLSDRMQRTRHMLIKEFIQIFRDPRMRGIIFATPLIQTLVFGYAVTTDVNNISTAIYDLDNSVASRNLISAYTNSRYFNIVNYIYDDNEMQTLLDHGDVQAVIHIKKGFEEDLRLGKTVSIQAIIEGTDANTAKIIQNYITKITHQVSQLFFVKRLNLMTGTPKKESGIQLQSRTWFNENLESHNFYVPGVVATILTLVTLTLTSMAIVREKEMGTIEQIMVSPISRFEFILGKTLPFVIIGMVNVTGILLISSFWFDVPIRGSLVTLYVSGSLYLLTILGIGLFISTISHTQQQAMMSAFLCYFPIILLSGFIFPIENMPVAIQLTSYINPLKYFLIIIRGIFLKGIGWEFLWPQILMLAMMGICTITLAVRRFQKTLG